MSEPANFYLIKLVSKWKRTIRKGHTSFLAFYFWDLKLVSIVSALNSTSAIATHFFQKYGRGITKCSQTWKFRLKVFWDVVYDLQPQKWKVLETKSFYRNLTRNRVNEKGYVVVWLWPFDLWPCPVSCQKQPK